MQVAIEEGGRLARKARFIRALAEFLEGNSAGKSIALEFEGRHPPLLPGIPKWAAEWSKLRSATPLFGYLGVEEAERQLWEFLG